MSAKVADNVSLEEFHPIFGKYFKVALKAHFDAKVEMVLDGLGLTLSDQERKQLIAHSKNEQSTTKVAHPAKISGDIRSDSEVEIAFRPIVSNKTVKFWQLCFRGKTARGNSNEFFPVRLARASESWTFGFDLFAKPYVNLAFFREDPKTKETTDFEPVFGKGMQEDGSMLYFVIEADYEALDRKEMGLKIHRVAETEVPPQLAVFDEF